MLMMLLVMVVVVVWDTSKGTVFEDWAPPDPMVYHHFLIK